MGIKRDRGFTDRVIVRVGLSLRRSADEVQNEFFEKIGLLTMQLALKLRCFAFLHTAMDFRFFRKWNDNNLVFSNY